MGCGIGWDDVSRCGLWRGSTRENRGWEGFLVLVSWRDAAVVGSFVHGRWDL